MSTTKKILVLFLFLSLTAPIYSQVFLSAENEIAASIESDEKETKSEKKKDKDLVTINSRFFITLAMDIAIIMLLILVIYYPNYRKMDTIFTFIVFNVMIFLLTFVLNKVKISMGAAFGLFAVFSMLRYRTEGIGMKDMTYLFIFIAIGLIAGIQLDYLVLGVIFIIIFVITLILDSNIFMKRELSQNIEFEKIELIKPELKEQLIAELKSRTGLNIHRVTIRKISYLKDTAVIRIFYYD